MILDSDVLIWQLRAKPAAVEFIGRVARTHDLAISVLTLAEVEAGLLPAEEPMVRRVLAALEVLPVTAEIAQTGGEFQRRFGRSHGTDLVDCLVAATAVVHELPLATLNVNHFPMIRGLKAAFKL